MSFHGTTATPNQAMELTAGRQEDGEEKRGHIYTSLRKAETRKR